MFKVDGAGQKGTEKGGFEREDMLDICISWSDWIIGRTKEWLHEQEEYYLPMRWPRQSARR
jgi:hypothetical protein